MTTMPSLQRRLRSAVDELVGTGAETGLQVAVHHRGVLVADAVAGVADSRSGRPVTARTPFFGFSAGKMTTSLIAHLLVRDGEIGYETPLVDVWPEFGRHGKAATTLRHVLTHTAGLPAMPRTIGPAALTDPVRVCAALADAVPRWAPGTETGYHAYTYGFLVGEIARRVTGKPMHRLLHERICEPLGLVGELYFGMPRSALPRPARLEDDAPPAPVAPDDDAVLAPWERQPVAALGNSPGIQQADIPSVGIFTARAMAAMNAAVLDGRLIGTAQLERLTAVAFDGTDR
ncbi:serine hydrolase, partial [Streptomyces sp. SID5785]|uniref:serine hydrolase domain-containing protein n=1 Tax=Streptomyces sp. SID5785 TaxID=2690309 RepID=UPI0013612228